MDLQYCPDCKQETVVVTPDGRKFCDDEYTECRYSYNPYRGKFFVNLYMGDRAFGGREEGGWWFDTGEFLRCMFVTTSKTKALAARDKIQRRVCDQMNEGRREKWSVLSQGVYEIQMDEHPGADYPTGRPYYC